MPLVLVALFTIALLVTITGLLLSPKSQPRDARNEYLVTPKGRRIVESMPAASTRGRRRNPVEDGQGFMDLSLPSVPARASRGTGAIKINTGLVVQRPLARSPRANRPRPLYREGLIDRFSDWKIALPGLSALFLLALYLFGLIFPHQAVWTSVWFGPLNSAPTPAPNNQTYHASQALIRLSQLDPGQYANANEYQTWAYSACSAASMTEVINSYGHQYHITDILNVESQIHEITPQDGLLEESGIQNTGNHFHFKTTWGHNLSLAQVIAAANSGTPVIVSFPPEKYPGGHLLVVRGGDSNNVFLADSSSYNRTQLSSASFMQYWGGFSAIMTPA